MKRIRAYVTSITLRSVLLIGFFGVFFFVVFLVGIFFFIRTLSHSTENTTPINSSQVYPSQAIPTATPTPLKPTVPTSYVIPQKLHVFQSFNNCGPAAFSMALSYYGISKSQTELGQELRPYQIPGGDNDDKSVTLEELAEKSKEYGFTPYLRPGGSMETLTRFISLGIPVITRTLLHTTDDIGHYRVLRGYDDTNQTILQDDSLQGGNLTYSYAEFDSLWRQFGYEYLVLIPQDKLQQAQEILGEDIDENKAWMKAKEAAQKQITADASNTASHLNLSVATYHLQQYKESVAAYEAVENRLSFRTLWYQIEPILSYYELGEYDKVFALTDKILSNQNRAYSELYYLRGQIYLKQGKQQEAKAEFEKAVFYKSNYQPAIDALNSL